MPTSTPLILIPPTPFTLYVTGLRLPGTKSFRLSDMQVEHRLSIPIGAESVSNLDSLARCFESVCACIAVAELDTRIAIAQIFWPLLLEARLGYIELAARLSFRCLVELLLAFFSSRSVITARRVRTSQQSTCLPSLSVLQPFHLNLTHFQTFRAAAGALDLCDFGV